MNRRDWVWLAGFLDGEGTFTINGGSKTNGVTGKIYSRMEARVCVSGNDRQVITWLGDEFHKKIVIRPPARKPTNSFVGGIAFYSSLHHSV